MRYIVYIVLHSKHQLLQFGDDSDEEGGKKIIDQTQTIIISRTNGLCWQCCLSCEWQQFIKTKANEHGI